MLSTAWLARGDSPSLLRDTSSQAPLEGLLSPLTPQTFMRWHHKAVPACSDAEDIASSTDRYNHPKPGGAASPVACESDPSSRKA
jgi:hypothetical protein